MANLTQNHLRFVQAKASGLKDREAAIHAGYAAKSAASTASRLMGRADIRAAIKQAKGNPDAAIVDEVAEAGSDNVKSYLKAKYKSSLELLRDVYNNPKAPVGIRIECAKIALPYEHGRIGEQGKKEAAQKKAEEVATGRFAARRRPGRPNLRAVS